MSIKRSLIPFGKNIPLPFGLENSGAKCYFNAFLQAIITCSSFNQVILEQSSNELYLRNPVYCILLEFIRSAVCRKDAPCIQTIDDISDYKAIENLDNNIAESKEFMTNMLPWSTKIWNVIMNVVIAKRQKDKYIATFSGNEDASEIMLYFFESIEELQELHYIFQYKVNVIVYCHLCKNIVVNKNEYHNIYEVEPNLNCDVENVDLQNIDKAPSNVDEKRPLLSYIVKNKSEVDTDYKCKFCNENNTSGVRAKRLKVTRLGYLGDVLIVLTKNYSAQKIETKFDSKLYFPSAKGVKVYVPVSYIDCSGVGQAAGHYWTFAKRKETNLLKNTQNQFDNADNFTNFDKIDNFDKTKWYRLDDSSFSKSTDFNPTNQTYVVFYHFSGYE
jgi:ubiquitin C-terminal hydrolase